MADNKINVGGRLHSIATGNVLAGANEILDDSKNKKQNVINAEVDIALADRYTKEETYNKNELDSLITTPDVQYVTVTATEQTTDVMDVLPATGAANTIYRVGNWDGSKYTTTVYSEYAWNGSTYVPLNVKENGIDDEPTAGSDNLVTSGGVFNSIGAFDISELNATENPHTPAKYTNLSAALNALPVQYRKGGMSVKFVRTSDNKYEQWRLINQNWSNAVDNWRENTEDIATNTRDIASITERIKNISKLGYCYDGRGGLLSINISTKTFTTTFSYAGIGKRGYKSMNNVSEKPITPRTDDGSYNGFWVAFLNWDTVEIEIYMFDSIPIDLENRYIVATGVGFNSSQCVQFSTSNISPSVNGQDENIAKNTQNIAKNTQNIAKNTQNIAKNTQNIATIEDSLGGTLWSNLFEGSDMEKGYNQNNILAFSTYPSLGGTVEKVLDDENSKYYIKAHFPSGTEFTSKDNYLHPSLMKNIIFVGQETTQEFSVSFRYKCSPNFKGFCPLCNNGWMQYLKSDGNWASLGTTTIPLERDNKWHYAHIVARKTDVSNKTYSIALYAFLANGKAVTLESDLDFCITDIVISTSRFPDYADVKNKKDYSIDITKEEIQPIVDEIINKYPDAYGCVFMSLGDSITTESYYIPKLRQILQPSKYYNLAVAGAHWADCNETTYDGNPVFNGPDNNKNNVLGNQVQKIINNPETYNVAPDIIIIAAGTNDGTPISADKSDYEMRVDIDSHFNENQTTPIQVTEPTFDDSDTYMSHRKTIAGAMRYCVLKLQSMYPKARIYILTPIQGSYNPNKDYLTAQEVKQRYISEVAKHLAVPVIHVGEECGINRDFEYGGTYWKEEWADENHPKQGRDLIDGLHPNTSGSWKMAKYIARELFNNYVNQNL